MSKKEWQWRFNGQRKIIKRIKEKSLSMPCNYGYAEKLAILVIEEFQRVFDLPDKTEKTGYKETCCSCFTVIEQEVPVSGYRHSQLRWDYVYGLSVAVLSEMVKVGHLRGYMREKEERQFRDAL